MFVFVCVCTSRAVVGRSWAVHAGTHAAPEQAFPTGGTPDVDAGTRLMTTMCGRRDARCIRPSRTVERQLRTVQGRDRRSEAR